MNLKLKKDIVIPAGTVFEESHVTKTRYYGNHVEHVLGFGRNAAGNLRLAPEVGDAEFDEWFEPTEKSKPA